MLLGLCLQLSPFYKVILIKSHLCYWVRFQMHLDSKILPNCPPHFKRDGLLYFHVMTFMETLCKLFSLYKSQSQLIIFLWIVMEYLSELCLKSHIFLNGQSSTNGFYGCSVKQRNFISWHIICSSKILKATTYWLWLFSPPFIRSLSLKVNPVVRSDFRCI
jgi:hypothetical protein